MSQTHGGPNAAGRSTATQRESAGTPAESLDLPVLVIRQSAVDHNIAHVQRMVDAHGALSAPHMKKVMAPDLLRRQLDAGAWGASVADVAQAEVAASAGAHRVIIANQVLGTAAVHRLMHLMRAGVELYCLVDSVAGTQLLDRQLRASGSTEELRILVEVGHVGGRAGTRTQSQTLETAAAVSSSQVLSLRGVETYEGLVGHDREPKTIEKVDHHLQMIRGQFEALMAARLFSGPPIISAGGTRFLDRVLAILGGPNEPSFDLVVRPGAYVTHGEPSTSGIASGLQPTLDLWAQVVSCPEPYLAIANVGKRRIGGCSVEDLRVREIVTPSGIRRAIRRDTVLLRGLDDQHAYLVHPTFECEVGDLVRFEFKSSIALDSWRTIPVVDDDGKILSFWDTHF